MRKSVLVTTVLLLALTMLVSITTVNPWLYPPDYPLGGEDKKFEMFGPRLDRILIKLYDGEILEFEAMERQEIDLVDWPLTKTYYDRWQISPDFDYIKVVSYGPDYGQRILDINNNPNEFLGYPPDPNYTNPVYPNPCGEEDLRKAIHYCVDKTRIVDECVGGLGFEMWTVLGPGWPKYQHPDIVPGGALEELCYLPNSTKGRELLIASANFYFDPPLGDVTQSAESQGSVLMWTVPDPDEQVSLKFFIREDDSQRKCAGDMIAECLVEQYGIDVQITYGDSTAAGIQCFANKDFHLYTGGWGLGADPDWLWWLYHIDLYWHPGKPLNYDFINIPEVNAAAELLIAPNTQQEAVDAALELQVAWQEAVPAIPMWETSGTMAIQDGYVGTPEADAEDPYEGLPWDGVVNDLGAGIGVSYVGLINMHPRGFEEGDCEHMTLRWGFRVKDMRALNPAWSEWTYDINVLGMIYDSLLISDPYDPSTYVGWLAKDYEVGNWYDPYPVDPEDPMSPPGGWKTKITFTLRQDVYWSDGVKFTADDVVWSLFDCLAASRAKGCPDPFIVVQSSNLVRSCYALDPCTVEVLYDMKSLWALSTVGGGIIIPRHIWEPLIATRPCGELVGWGPDLDPNLVGTGPYKFVEYVEGSHIILEKNPNFFQYGPIHINVHTSGPEDLKYRQYIPYCTNINVSVSVHNLWLNDSHTETSYLDVDKTVILDGTPIVTDENIRLMSCVPDIELLPELTNVHFEPGIHNITVIVTVKGPAELHTCGLPDVDNPWMNMVDDYTYLLWVSKNEDTNKDFVVDISDLYACALAYGTEPGHPKWDASVDVNGDDIIDISDLYSIALEYGWPPS